MKLSSPFIRGLAVLAVASFLMVGCTVPDPNKNKQLGPNVQLVLFPINGTSGPTNFNTPDGNKEYLLNMTDASQASLNPLIQWEIPNTDPVYDWIILVVPGDNSGISAHSVNVSFWGSCNQGLTPQSTQVGSFSQGSPGGPVLPASKVSYSIELTGTKAKTYTCQNPNGGNAFPGTSDGVWQFQGKATNGLGLSSSYSVEIQVGNAPLPNNGP
jgi:hypothetical protein